MSVLPVSGFLSNPGRTEGEMKTALEDVRDVIAELLGGSIETELTIATGSVTPTGAVHSIDTESDAASDDLANILQTNHPDGRLLLIHANDGARDVVVKDSAGGAGQIILRGAADFTLDTTDKWLLLKRTGTNWEELFRSIITVKKDTDRITANLTTTSGSFVDATGLSITFTTGANRVLLILNTTVSNASATVSTDLTFDIDGTDVGGSRGLVGIPSVAAGERQQVGMSYLTDVLTAASHTFKVTWKSGDGVNTSTMHAVDNHTIFSAIEILGG